jgi:hypothetical protein
MIRKCAGVVLKPRANSYIMEEVFCEHRWKCMRFVHTTSNPPGDFFFPKEVYPQCEEYLELPREMQDGYSQHQFGQHG